MIAPRIFLYTIIMIIVGYVIGLVPFVSESFISCLTPLSKLVAVNISLASAAGLNLAILLSAISAVMYSVFSEDEAVEIFEWYGCLLFGGAMAVVCYWVMVSGYLIVSSAGGAGRHMQFLYSVLNVPIALYVVSVLFLVLGAMGLYLMGKAPSLLVRRFASGRSEV